MEGAAPWPRAGSADAQMIDVPRITDLAYAPAEPATGRGHLLDLYLPEPASPTPSPLVIWSSGSAWRSDDGKAGAADVAPFFNARGYAVAGVSVRSSAQARFPAQLHDINAAIRFLRARATTYHIDPGRFAIMGNSSGGWLAAIAALTPDMPALDGTQRISSEVQAAVDFYGPTDFLQMDAHTPDRALCNRALGTLDCHSDPRSPESRLIGGAIQTCPEAAARANPITYIHHAAPPMLLLHGQADPLVPHDQSVLLYEALKTAGSQAVFFSIPDIGHEHPYVTDPKRATGHTVYATANGTEEVTFGTPGPTWHTIERFLSHALTPRWARRAQGA